MKFLPADDRDRRRQLLWLAAAVAALLAVLWFQRGPAAVPAVASNPAMTARAQAVPDAWPLPEAIDLDALASVPERSDEGRNPFGFGVRPSPPPPPPVALPPPVVAVAPPPPARPSGPPPITLTLSGMLTMPGSDRTMVMLRDPVTGASYRAYEGDIVDGRYRVVKVGLQSVVVSYVDGSGQRTIPLGG